MLACISSSVENLVIFSPLPKGWVCTIATISFDRGFIRKGYYADLVLVDPNANWQVGEGRYYTKCGWTPMDERTFKWKVVRTLVNGVTAYVDGIVIDGVRGSELVYD